MVDIITYEALYDILRKEKYEKDLQKLDPNFFQLVVRYLQEKEAILLSQKSKDSVFAKESDKTQKQLENIFKILRDIYEKRENKIVQYALVSSRFNDNKLPNMLSEESQLYTQLLLILNKYRKNILDNLLSKRLPNFIDDKIEKQISFIEKETKIDEHKLKLLRVLEPVPQFVGDDLVVYGPFEIEDMVSLPANLANLLVNKNKAEEVKPQ